MLVIDTLKAHTRKATITQWYEEIFPVVAAYIQRRGGDIEDAKEIFQESVVLYYEKLQSGNFEPQAGDRAYLMGIAKKRWLKHCETTVEKESLEFVEITEENIPKPLKQKLLRYLERAGEKCMNLLQLFYYEKLTMKQVANQFGYTSERSATVQKYKCLEKVRDEIKRKSLSYEDFLD